MTGAPRCSVQLEVGEVLSGTLRLTRKIADGGMGSVWIAEHLVLGREVAVKFMAGPWASVPSARMRFLREARMTAQIDSPHVVRVLDCRIDADKEPYLVLELLRGENLDQRVQGSGILSIAEVLQVASQACEALAATHDAGILHRDLKPENVFLVDGATPFVKLLDFGVAKPKHVEGRLDVDRLSAGTPRYMSPEQMFEPESSDERSDLFSLAAVLYFALTGRGPFEADSLEGLYFAIGNGVFRRPSALRPDLPRAIDRWFERALAHDPAKRFASAREMARALRDAAREARIGSSDGAEATPARHVRRSRTRALVGLGLAVTAASCGWKASSPMPTASASSHGGELSDRASRPHESSPRPAAEACGPSGAPSTDGTPIQSSWDELP